MQTMSDTIAVEQETQGYASIDRNDAIRAIRAALKRRSGKPWSVKGDTGTAWGWITIDAPPKRRTARWIDNGRKDNRGYTAYDLEDTGEVGGYITPADQAELCALLGLERMHHQGISIPAGNDYRVEYVNRAEGRNPSAYGTPYWD
jgi:hypothetical protein